jgi:autophagy-related protein 16
VCFNPIGDVVATGGGDALIRLWNSSNGKEIQTLRGFAKPITDIAISMDNELIAASSTEHKSIVWGLKTMRSVHSFQGHKDTINANKFSFAKKCLITGSLDRTIKYWDLEKGICTKTVILSLSTHLLLECLHVSVLRRERICI